MISAKNSWRPIWLWPMRPNRICLSARAASSAFRISSCGSWPTRNCSLPIPTGPTLARKVWMRRSPPTSTANAVSAAPVRNWQKRQADAENPDYYGRAAAGRAAARAVLPVLPRRGRRGDAVRGGCPVGSGAPVRRERRQSQTGGGGRWRAVRAADAGGQAIIGEFAVRRGLFAVADPLRAHAGHGPAPAAGRRQLVDGDHF